MKKRTLLYSLLLIMIAMGSRLWADALKPNIILFVSDDHGIDALGCYENPVIQTPYMDRLAAEGVRFTRAYCTSTGPQCKSLNRRVMNPCT